MNININTQNSIYSYKSPIITKQKSTTTNCSQINSGNSVMKSLNSMSNMNKFGVSFKNNKRAHYYNQSKLFVNMNSILAKSYNEERRARTKGCLMAGALGDALGAKIEWYSNDRIKQRYGVNGLKYIPKSSGVYRVTDDTQMTLFTAEGLIKSLHSQGGVEKEPDYDTIYNSYKNWYSTQTLPYDKVAKKTLLLREPNLYVKRGPGRTCMTALASGIKGTYEHRINDSMGNGGIMRSAPIGIMYSSDPELAFKVAVKSTLLTHGHENAFLPAGFQAALIANLLQDKSLGEAISNSIDILKTYPKHEDTLNCVEKAISLAKTDIEPSQAIEKIGFGGRGDEALGIALYSVLKNPNNVKNALFTAVNHSGDSDSTGAIAGNIIGAYLGIQSIPVQWSENIEHLNLLNIMAIGLTPEENIDEPIQENSIQKKETNLADDSLDLRTEDDSFFDSKK